MTLIFFPLGSTVLKRLFIARRSTITGFEYSIELVPNKQEGSLRHYSPFSIPALEPVLFPIANLNLFLAEMENLTSTLVLY